LQVVADVSSSIPKILWQERQNRREKLEGKKVITSKAFPLGLKRMETPLAHRFRSLIYIEAEWFFKLF